MNFGWASPDYLLNQMSLPTIFMYYDYMVGELTGEPEKHGPEADKPNREKFHEIYGDKIKTPDRKGAE